MIGKYSPIMSGSCCPTPCPIPTPCCRWPSNGNCSGNMFSNPIALFLILSLIGNGGFGGDNDDGYDEDNGNNMFSLIILLLLYLMFSNGGFQEE